MEPFSQYNGQALPRDVYLILSHASGASVLMVREGGGWTLPHVMSETADFRLVRHINDHVQAQYGLQSMVQRCLASHGGPERGRPYRVYVLTHLGSAPPLPDGARWMTAGDLDHVALTVPGHREIVRRWRQDTQTSISSEWQPPWTAAGWFHEVSQWIETQLTRHHLQVLGPTRQHSVWAIACVLRTETHRGAVSFKTAAPFMVQEAMVIHDLSQRHPDLLPSLLATDRQRGWTLTADRGDRLLTPMSEISHWEGALRRFAQMQVTQAEHLYDWLSQGVPDRRLKRMVAMIDPLITDAAECLADRPEGLSNGEIEGLHALPMKLKLLCANLAGYRVPQTLVHGNLSGNLWVEGERYGVEDWSQVCIAHPFFDMAPIIERAMRERVRPFEQDVRARLRDAYLAPWTVYEPMDRLVHAFELSTSLGALHQAMSSMWMLMNVAPEARWQFERGLVKWLRRLLQLLPPV